MGFTSAETLSAVHNIMVIEHDAVKADAVKNLLNVSVLHENGTNPKVLEAAIDKHGAEIVISTLPTDDQNLFICMIAKVPSASQNHSHDKKSGLHDQNNGGRGSRSRHDHLAGNNQFEQNFQTVHTGKSDRLREHQNPGSRDSHVQSRSRTRNRGKGSHESRSAQGMQHSERVQGGRRNRRRGNGRDTSRRQNHGNRERQGNKRVQQNDGRKKRSPRIRHSRSGRRGNERRQIPEFDGQKGLHKDNRGRHRTLQTGFQNPYRCDSGQFRYDRPVCSENGKRGQGRCPDKRHRCGRKICLPAWPH